MTGAKYDFGFDAGGVYERAAALVSEHAGAEGVHLDLGCGYGALAEAVREQGLTYIGFDLDEQGLAALRDRGFETAVVDLQDVPAAMSAVDAVVAGRPIASISLLDTLEHVTTGPELLAALHARATSNRAPLVVSVPNVAHHDIAIKLLAGRFDYTRTGLLDSTHVVLYTEAFLARAMVAAGWREVAARDLPLEWSDQHFPAEHAALADGSVLHRFLVGLRKRADEHGSTNQFIRAYLPGRPEQREALVDPEPPADRPFLTVVVRTQGRRLGTLRDALLCLMGQTCDDFEVVVTAHRTSTAEHAAVEAVVAELPADLRVRTRVLVVEGGGRARPLNAAVAVANGRYLAVLDDDDLVFAHWLEAFRDLASTAPGNVLRAVCVEQRIEPAEWAGHADGVRATGGLVASYPGHFDLMAHIGRNHTPFMCYAFPTSVFHDLGLRFDESLDICEDWDLELRAALLVGVASTPEVTAIYRRWAGGSSSASLHDEEQWRRAESAILARIDAAPHVFPAGTIAAIREATLRGQHRAEQEIRALVERNRELEEHALRMERSTSWRVTAPLRRITGLRRSGG